MNSTICPREPSRYPLLASRQRVGADDARCMCGFADDAHGLDIGEISGLVCPVTRPWSGSSLTLAEAREIQARLGGEK